MTKATFKRRAPVVKGRSTKGEQPTLVEKLLSRTTEGRKALRRHDKEPKVVKVRISASVDLAAKLILERIAMQQGRSPSNALNMILLRAGELALPEPTEAQAASKPGTAP